MVTQTNGTVEELRQVFILLGKVGNDPYIRRRHKKKKTYKIDTELLWK
jgi:hypothetical protein